jgi:hypothetical protein
VSEQPLTKNHRYFAYTLHAVAIVVGIWIGIELYEWVTGEAVSLGFR